MSEVNSIVIQKDKFFVGVALSSKGVYGNTIPYSSREVVQEKIAKYFSESRIVDTYESQKLNDLAEDVAGLILQRWLGKDYNLSYDIPIDFTEFPEKHQAPLHKHPASCSH